MMHKGVLLLSLFWAFAVAGDCIEPCRHVNVCGRWNGYYPRHDATPSHLGCYPNACGSESLPCLV
jgi:hypothetical protein